MKRHILFYALFLSTLSPHISFSLDKKDVVLSVDLDDVLSKKQSTNLNVFSGIFSQGFWHPIDYVKLLLAVKALNEDKSNPTDGAGNLFYKAAQKLKKDKSTDFSDQLVEIVERSVDPLPLENVVAFLRELKKKGYILVAATNQDYLQNKFYRKKMKDKGIDLNTLFDGIVVTRTQHLKQMNGEPIQEDKPFTITEQNVFMLNNPKSVKPNKKYYKALKKVAKKIQDGNDLVIHVDDKKENIDSANKMSGVKGILFDIGGKSARRSTPDQIQKALEGYKAGLQGMGIEIP